MLGMSVVFSRCAQSQTCLGSPCNSWSDRPCVYIPLFLGAMPVLVPLDTIQRSSLTSEQAAALDSCKADADVVAETGLVEELMAVGLLWVNRSRSCTQQALLVQACL